MPAGILVGTREEAHYPGSQPRPFAILSPLTPGRASLILSWARLWSLLVVPVSP